MTGRIFFGIWTSLGLLVSLGCSSSPHTLVVVEASTHPSDVETTTKRFETEHHRPVRVIHANKPSEAIVLASRGEAEVALVPSGTELGEFFASHHGHARGNATIAGETLNVIEVDGGTHPKIDGSGAKELAEFLAGAH